MLKVDSTFRSPLPEGAAISCFFPTMKIPSSFLALILTTTTLASPCLLADEAAIMARLKALGAEVTEQQGVAAKVFFRDSKALGDAEYRDIGQLKSLKALTLYGSCKGLDDTSLPHLAGLAQLEELSTDGLQTSDEGLKHLAALVSLKSAAFFHASFRKEGFTGVGFRHLAALPKLERLTVAGMSMGDEGFAAIAEIRQLRDFSTWHTYQTEAGNAHIARLGNLRSLRIGQRLPRRVDGVAAPPSLTNASLKTFADGLPHLESLTLMEGRFSVEALGTLGDLKHLTKLKMEVAPLTAEDLEKAKAALPGLELQWKPLTEEEARRLEMYLKP